MDRYSHQSGSALSSPWFYFAAAFGWSWSLWLAAMALGFSFASAPGVALGMLGLLGPLVGGLIGTYVSGDREQRRDYWRRVIDVRRIGVVWYLVIVLFVPVLFALSVGADILTGGTGGVWEEPALRVFAQPWAIIPFALSILLVGPMEEFGWRGYVLDKLQARWNALTSALILGVFWSLWHLPLFFWPGSYQYNLGAGSLSFWLFMVGIVPLTVVFSWIFNNTRRSTLSAMLFHFMVNFTGQCVEFTPRAEVYSIVFWTIAAIAVTIVWGPKTLTRKN